jgi:hypothetical protein
MNLYAYETREALITNNSKIDALSGKYLNNQQQVFRNYNYQTKQTSYFYRTNETLIGKCSKPTLIKRHWRLGTRSLNPSNLLSLANKSQHKETIHLKSPKQSTTFIHSPETFQDFQEFLVTNLLLFSHKAEFLHAPLEQSLVSKLRSKCDKNVQSHFTPKPLFHFTFSPESVPLVLAFLNNLDCHADYFDLEETKDFYDTRFKVPPKARNAYLNH